MFNTLSYQEKNIFINQFSTLIKGGINFSRCFLIISEDPQLKKMKSSLLRASEECEDGESVSVVFEEQLEKYLGKLVTNYIRIAEKTGQWEPILTGLTEIITISYEVEGQLKSILLFPVMGLVLLIFSLLISVSVKITAGFLVLLFFLKISGVNFSDFLRGFYQFLRILPLVRKPLIQYDKIQYLKSFALIYQSGYPVNMADTLLNQLIESNSLKKESKLIFSLVKRGKSLSESFQASSLFSGLEKSFIETGEQSGSVDVMLLHLVRMEHQRLTIQLESLLKVLSPLFNLMGSALIGGALYLLITRFGTPL